MAQTVTTDLLQTLTDRMKLDDQQKRAIAELILLNPELLVNQYKNSQALSTEAEQYAKDGNLLVAENRYASAVKLALHEGNIQSAKRYLEECAKLDLTHNFAYKTALNDFETISQCIVDFYKAKSSGVTNP